MAKKIYYEAEAREKVLPWTKESAKLSDKEFLAVFPHYCSVKEV